MTILERTEKQLKTIQDCIFDKGFAVVGKAEIVQLLQDIIEELKKK